MSQQEALLRERLREAARVLREVRLERDALAKERSEPIAIIGIGCRLPGGANSPQAFWDLLAAGRDAIVPLEPRWKLVGAHPDAEVPRWAGLLTEAVEDFEPEFFGISPREARAMDPQQRLLLEVAWEALEDAGIVPPSLHQSRTGVFIGACAADYASLAARQPPAAQDAYLATGNMLSIAAGRLAYTLGLQGPCLTLDTACSSSLVAIHLACSSLRSRESDLALAGGVSLILSPDIMTALSRTQALSPDGRCRTFDALANGYVRGEGCGLLVLKRLGEAQQDGDRIWAVIRGSAVNQDGRSTGLTAPNVLAQEALLREALKSAGVEPQAVGYVETFGTGTSLGDPIEVQALRAVLGKPRADGGRCILGAVKTNIGHLEGAAGVAGVIKAALVLAKQRIPKNLHLRTLNAHIELDGSSLALASEPSEWRRGDKPRLAGVSGFGLSGTNAHIVLEEAPPSVRTEPGAVPAVPLLLSGRSEAALRAQAAQLGAYLASHPDESLLDIAYMLACKRTHFEQRASIDAKNPEELHEALAALAHGQASALFRSATARSPGKLAFLFTGQGSQRPAMGRSLALGLPRFRDALDAVLAALDPLLPRPLRQVMFADSHTPEAQLLDQTGYTQPALFALQVALFRFVESLGITPDFLLGHSVGEIAAAHVGGVLSLSDASRLVVARGQLMQALPAGGAMVALQAAEAEVRGLLAGKESVLDIAASNGPLHTVISGDEEAVLEVARHFEARGRKYTRLLVSHAFHSPHMDAMARSFREVAAGLSYQKPRIPLISSLTGELAEAGALSHSEYWVKQARATVRFHESMATLSAAGVKSYLELGPRGVLCAMGAECLTEAAARESDFVALLRGEAPELAAFRQALGRLHVRGLAIDFGALLSPTQLQLIDLPKYPFQRQRCWLDAPRGADASGLSAAGPSGASDPSKVSARLGALSADEQLGEVLELVRREVAVVLGRESSADLTSAPAPEQPLRALGLDSLMTVELRNRLQGLFGVRLELSAIWRLANLRELAAELVRLLAAQPRPTAPSEIALREPSSPAGRPLLAPLSAGQQRLYFLHRVLELRHTYNLALAIRLPAALDVGLLRSAVELLIARHEQLRVCFLEQDGQPRQRILPWVEPPIEELSLITTEEAPDTALRQLIELECQKPFELSRAPLFRLLVIRLPQGASALAVLWHHITTDGASMSIFISELSAAYQSLRGGAEPAFTAGPSYALYAARQREWLQSLACSAQRAFWKARLAGLPALELPTDRAASRLRTERGGLVKFMISAKTSAAVEVLGKRLRSTSFVILSAAWSALLSRYTGQQDFAIGATMAGRPDDTALDAIGFFVNTLPLRCPLQGEPTGLEYVQRLHAEIWSALEHQELPLDEIVRAVVPDRQPGFLGSPLFRTCISYNEARAATDSFAGMPAVFVVDPVIEKVGGTSKFDLLLSVIKLPQGFAAALEFSTDLFDVATMERCAQHFIALLTHLVEQPEHRIHELQLLTEAERQQLLFGWNDTKAEYPRSACLHELFEAQVARCPDAEALVYEDERLSYRALNAKANQLAHRLRTLGVGPDVLVALCVERSLAMVVAILGILKAGGAYVPIDPDLPAQRIDFMLKDTRPAAVLIQRRLIENLPQSSVPILCLDDPATFSGQPADNLSCLASSANLAYVIYTSGSTGRPKGVLMEQHSVSNLLQALNRRAWGAAPLRAAMLAPIFFDMSVKPLFGSLLYGHTLYIVDKQTRRDGGALLSFFQRHAIAWSDCTPSILAMLVEAGLPTCQPLALQVLLCGGEALSTALVASVYTPRIHSALQVINVYGPTETCVNVNANPVTAQSIDMARAGVPLGRPLDNTQIYILDAHLQPMPVGIPGELHIGGVGLARGYLNRPELTAEKFIPNPFSADPGSRLYKTGDLACFLADGKIEFLGRIDHQVKLRGYRIELGEVEAILSSHPEVASCVVMAREDAPAEKRLVAYAVPQPGRSLAAEALRAYLAKQLPDYMLPAAFVFLASLPVNRNGKVERRALPAPARELGEDSFAPPANPLESALADIFASVLKQKRIGRHDDFFAVGGDSLLAVRAVTRAQQAGLALTVNQLFAHPTLAKLYAQMAGTARATCMMLLQEGQEPGGVILVPGAGGVFHRPHDIARALAAPVPIFGLIAPRLAGVQERPDSLVALAALYAQDLVQRIPQGPLTLIGYSFGGPVAVAMAEALLTMDRAVERVILLDARPSVGDVKLELDAQTALDAILDTLGIPASRLQGLAEPLAALISLLAPDVAEAQGLHAFLAALLENVRDASKMLGAWQPRLPNVPVHLLRAEGNEERGADYAWSQHGSLASVQTIAGQHYSLLRDPYLATTMQAIRSLLGLNRSQGS